MHRIKEVIIKTMISIEPHVVATFSRCTKHRNVCFEVYGFDILLDNKLKAWLLEVNISPSLSSSSPLDKKIKTVLLCDTLNLIGVYPYDRKQYEKEMESILKKRLLGLDRPLKGEDALDLIPESYLQKIVKQLNKDADGASQLSEEDVNIIIEFEEEQFRLGNFEKIFPSINNVNTFAPLFENHRSANALLQRYLCALSPKHNPHHMNYIPPAGQPIMAPTAGINGGQTETKPGRQQPKGRKKAHGQDPSEQQEDAIGEEEEDVC